MLERALDSILNQGGPYAALVVILALTVIVLYKANNDLRTKIDTMRDVYEKKVEGLYDQMNKETRNSTVALERNTVAMNESAKSMDGRSQVIDRAVMTIDKVATSIEKMAMTNETVREHFKERVGKMEESLSSILTTVRGSK